MGKPIIYFLCTGNSCRSQMAEGFGHQYLGDRFDVHSAGVEAHGVNPEAVKAMIEAGVEISDQASETIDPDLLNQADYVITLCGDAKDKCPIMPSHVNRIHWELDDPAKAEGTEKEKREAFRRVRDDIDERIQTFSKQIR